MTTRMTGRKLDSQGNPINGTGFAYESGDPLDELLNQRISPLFSQPVTGEWVCGLVVSAQTGGEYERGLGIFSPKNAGPPEHFHPTYVEHFEIVRGEFVFRIGGTEQKASAGDQLAVPKGTPHTFYCVGTQPGVVIVETRPAARTGEVIATLFGLAHEGALTPKGQPKMWQAMVIGAEYSDDTVFTSPPPSLTIPMAKVLAPIARRMGYRATYPRFADPDFWNARVEQPPQSGASGEN